MIAQAYSPESFRVVPANSLHLVEEINHRVANQFAEAVATLSLAAARIGDIDARRALTGAADRLRDHAASHRALLPPAGDERNNLADYIGSLCHAFTKATLAERGIRLVLDAQELLMPADRCWRIGLALAELIRNAARHAFDGQGGQITVHLAERSGWISCLVCDTGQAPARIVAGHGQRLIRSLATDLRGTIEWSFTSSGSFALLQVPITGEETDAETHLVDATKDGRIRG